MENKQEKSQAELYREERKQRIAKASKKSSKKSPQLSHFGKGLGKVCGGVIIAAICLVVLYYILNFFGVPQQVMTAVKVGDQKVSVATYNYYYLNSYQRVFSYAQQYESYYGNGYGKIATGFDYSVDPTKQDYVGEAIEGEDIKTWADYFEYNAVQYVQEVYTYSKLAEDAGVKITEDQQKEIDDQISQLKTQAENADYSLNRYIAANFGNGCTEKTLRKILEKQYLAQNFTEQKQEEIKSSITEAQAQEEFEKNKANYTTFGVAMFEVTTVTPEYPENATDEQKSAANEAAKAEAKAKADSYLAVVTNEDTVLAKAKEYNSKLGTDSVVYKDATADSVKSYSEAAANWIFESGRAVGDKAVFESNNGYLVILVTSLPVRDTTRGVNVRHILIQFPTDSSTGAAQTLTSEEKQPYFDKANQIYNKYKENPTEDNFSALAKENSEDPGSKDNGGLYESVFPGAMVQQFNDWIFDASRQPGDTGVIETTYGYHVMYYVNNNGDEHWLSLCKDAVQQNLLNDFDKNAKDGENGKLEKKNLGIKLGYSTIKNMLATTRVNASNSAKSSSSTYTAN